MGKSHKILIGADSIKEYIGVSSQDLFKKFMQAKLPVLVLDGRMYAHAENLDAYFKTLTQKPQTITSNDL